ncbi:helix-turn-helix domain-containing protein [Streptomyces sp. A1136]|uniref:helix-turn-helix domain-containing protein n=1 Tax=Streptomyces sp. A1136 TaxID=2563102 RepID=UPI00109E4CB2|nr:helix-turn-helix domain-containing protein [Streptomyces sp. A1136]THA48127.1 helix-turn-helix domain-containing protein [Streptomyces sp. A1136]
MAYTQSSAPSRAPSRVAPGNHRSGVIHVKSRHRNRFTVVGNHLAQHAGLSATAIGVAVYIQSLRDGAPVGIKVLAAHFPEGEIRLAAALRELEQCGYVERRTVRLDGGRMVTRTYYYEQPGADPDEATPPRQGRVRPVPVTRREPEPDPKPAPGPVVEPVWEPDVPDPEAEEPVPEAEEQGLEAADPLHPAAIDLLAGLRALDPRVLLSERDILRLAPGTSTWLERGVAPDAIARKLTVDLPDHIRHPASVLAYRLTAFLPPPVPAVPPEESNRARPDPLQTCDGCERAFRAREPGRCRDCRVTAAAA